MPLLVADPLFYCVAIPAVLLMGIGKSGFGVGLGSLAVPLMALAVTVSQAAAMLMPVLLLVDMLGLAAFRNHFDRRLVLFLIPFGLVGTLIGTFSFKLLDEKLVAGLVGLFTLLFLAQRLLFPPKPDSPSPPRWLGAILTTMSGFTSFIAHAGAPPINAYVIPMRLPPVTFAATMAAFFTVMNLSKWIPYAWLGLLDARTMATSITLLPFAPIGVWVGVRLAKRIKPALFYRLVYAGMFLTGLRLTWEGFVAG